MGESVDFVALHVQAPLWRHVVLLPEHHQRLEHALHLLCQKHAQIYKEIV